MFEPDWENSRLLAKAIKCNCMNGIFVFPCAVSEKTGIAEFLDYDASGATGSLVD